MLKTVPVALRRMPFAPGLPTKDGLAIGTQMSTRIDLTPAQYDKWLAIEAHFCNTMVEHRTMVFPHDKKKGETACSKEVFLSKMKRKAIPADPEKGYSASLQVRVNHEEGKQPKVLLTKMIEEGPHAGKNTQPKQGCFEDLTAKCAGAFQARVRGGRVQKPASNPMHPSSPSETSMQPQSIPGAYYGNFGMGLPVTLEAACIVVNKQGTGGPTIDFSETEFVPESEVPGLKDEPVAKDDEGSADEEPYTTEQFDRDIARA